MIHIKLLEKQEQGNPKINRSKEIIKISVEINELETKKPKTRYNKSMKQKVGSLII
jgi:hypothetical protein